MKKHWFLTTIGFLLLATTSFAQVCQPDQYDMLAWSQLAVAPFNGQQAYLVGNNNPLWTQLDPPNGNLYWVKSTTNGFPWDVKGYDSNYVYDKITEQNWNDPHTYKNFEIPLPMFPRCVTIPSVWGQKINSATITIPSSQTYFDIHSSCASFTRHNLGYVVNELWGPFQDSFGGSLPANNPTLVFSYRYNCDSTYTTCNDKETFALQQGYGLVQWTHFTWAGSSWSQANQSTFNQLNYTSLPTPEHPCWQ